MYKKLDNKGFELARLFWHREVRLCDINIFVVQTQHIVLMFLCLKIEKRNRREQDIPVAPGKTCNSCQKGLSLCLKIEKRKRREQDIPVTLGNSCYSCQKKFV